MLLYEYGDKADRFSVSGDPHTPMCRADFENKCEVNFYDDNNMVGSSYRRSPY